MSYTDFIDKNIAPLNATKIGVYNGDIKVGKIEIPSTLKPNLGRKLYSFGAISDIHLNTSTADSDLRTALTYFNQVENVAFTCVTGDVSDGGQPVQLSTFKTIVNEVSPNVRVYATNGNHEIYNSSFSDELWETYVDNPRDYVFTYQNDVFVFLGVRSSGSASNVYTSEQQRWLENILSVYSNSRVFIFTHCFINGTDNGNYNNVYTVNMLTKTSTYGKWLLDLLKQYKNVCLFTGHSHLKFTTQSFTDKMNICNEVDGVETGYLIHLPSITCPRYITNNGTGISEKIAGESEGVIIDVYQNGIVYRGRDFVRENFVPIGQYFLPIPEGETPSNLNCTALTLNQTELTITEKGKVQLTATKTPTNCIDAVTWESSNDSVAIVSSTGLITPRENGSCTITARCGTKTATCNITVNMVTLPMTPISVTWVDNVKIDKESGGESSMELYCASEYINYNSNYSYELDFNKAKSEISVSNPIFSLSVCYYDVNKAFIRCLPSNGYIITCGSTQFADTIPQIGTAIPTVENAKFIRLRVYANNKQVREEFKSTLVLNSNYEIRDIKPTALTLNNTILNLTTSDSVTLTAIPTPEDTNYSVNWSVNKTGICDLVNDNRNCVITPIINGTCIVTASCGEQTATCTVTVNIANANIEITPTYKTNTTLSKTDGTETSSAPYACSDFIEYDLNFDYKLKLLGCHLKNIAVSVVHYDSSKHWVGYSADIVKIPSNANQTTILESLIPSIENTAYIRLRMYGGNVANCETIISCLHLYTNKTIDSVPCTGISVEPTELTITSSNAQALTVTLTPANTSQPVTYTSSNPSIATVENGAVEPVASGNCVITVRCGTQSATCNVTVDIANLDIVPTWFDNLKIDRNTGRETTNANYFASDYIIMLDSKNYIMNFNYTTARCSCYPCYYDKDKTFISCGAVLVNNNESVSKNVTIPKVNGARYVRLRGYCDSTVSIPTAKQSITVSCN